MNFFHDTSLQPVNSTPLLIYRANMPNKASEEKANLAKKLAEQRAKGLEGIPTTAKVRYLRAFIDRVNKTYVFYY